jgi:HEXXH motif-containing protein
MFDVAELWLLGRFPSSNARAPRRGWLLERSGAVPVDVERQVKKQGLVPLDINEEPVDFFHRAEELIAFAPSLALLISSLVDQLHLLRADAGYDVSHSEPRWRSRIFVSLPDRSDDVGALRFAEGIVHEAMHLNLTLFEDRHPIVADLKGLMVSPWRTEPRPYQGVAHGLFVFACLRAYFNALRHWRLGTVSGHIETRIAEISSEISSINLTELNCGLTPLGQTFAAAWYGAATAH